MFNYLNYKLKQYHDFMSRLIIQERLPTLNLEQREVYKKWCNWWMWDIARYSLECKLVQGKHTNQHHPGRGEEEERRQGRVSLPLHQTGCHRKINAEGWSTHHPRDLHGPQVDVWVLELVLERCEEKKGDLGAEAEYLSGQSRPRWYQLCRLLGQGQRRNSAHHWGHQAAHGAASRSWVLTPPTNGDSKMVNSHMINKLCDNENIYQSSNSVRQEHIQPLEFINYLNPLAFHLTCSGSRLVSAPCSSGTSILWNKHCNEIQYIITYLDNHIIEGEVATRNHKGKWLLIPHIQHEKEIVSEKAAFAMTANKSQGQTLTKMGIFLPTDFFSHQQMYVAQPIAGSEDKMNILVPRGKMTGMNWCYVQNVVHQ